MSERPLLTQDVSLPRSSAIVSISLLLTALLGAGQALLLVFIVGEGDRTDAFLAAYSLYVVVALFGASLRGSLVPLFGAHDSDAGLREQVAETTARVLGLGLVVCALLIVISPLVGQLMTLGLPPDDRWIAVFSLLILAPAAYLQIHAAAISAALTASRRFAFSASLYVLAGVLALGCSAALLASIGVMGAALGLLAGSGLLAVGHSAYLRRFGVPLRPRLASLGDRRQRELGIFLVSGAAIGLALQIDLALGLSVLSADPGAITTYSYAFFIVSLMVNVSSLPLSLVTMPDLLARVARQGMAAAEEQLETMAPYAFAVLAPLLAGFAAYGHPLLEAVFEGSLSPSNIDLLYDLGLILGVMAIPNALLFLAGAVTLALGRARLFLLVGAVSVAVQTVVVISLSTFGPLAVAAGHVGTAVVTTSLLLRVTYGRRWLDVTASALWRSAPAFAFAAVFGLLRLPLGSDPSLAAACAGLVASALAYTVLALVLWRSVSTVFLALLRHPSRAA